MAALMLSGCGLNLDMDPLAFMTSPPNNEKKDKRVESLAPPDLLMNAPPLELNPGGSLGVFGLNLETYFAGDMGNDEAARIERLEKALIAMHRDIKTILPTVQLYADREKKKIDVTALQPPQSLLVQGGDIDRDSSELDSDLPPPGDPVQPGPRPLPSAAESAIISGIRVGQHSDRVRVVFDVTKKGTPFNADLDNNEHILVVELPNAHWETPVLSESFGKMPVLESYKVEPFNNGQGNVFVLQLKGSSKILAQSKLKALSGGGERIVIDLAK